MVYIEFSWLFDEASLKDAVQSLMGSSGQLIKKHLSSKEQRRPLRSRDVSRLPLDLVNHLKINPEYCGPRVTILRESTDVIVLHKPAGIHCHPLRYSDNKTLLNSLVAMEKWDALSVNLGNYDRGLLYRLDEETSGVMVLARNDKIYQDMREQFSQKMKRKFYWAIVEGDFDQEGVWKHFFQATGHKGGKQKVSLAPHPGSQEGILQVRKIITANGKSLLLVKLISGLRHQIRAQLSSLGFPILGDELYQGKKSQRIFLHALRYEWTHVEEDPDAELFDLFFNLNSALKMTHDMIGSF